MIWDMQWQHPWRKSELKVFVFDVDGTLIVKGKQTIPSSAVKALLGLKEQGHILVVASGRGYNALDQQLSDKIPFEYYICSNGATITDRFQKYRVLTSMDESIIKSLLEDSKKFNGAFELCYYNGVRVLFGYQKLREMATYFLGEEKFKEFYSLKPSGPPLNGKIYIQDELLQYYQKKYPHFLFTSTGYKHVYDVVPEKQTKGNALEILCKDLSISREDVIAFGDDENDLSMIKYANIGVAMGNGNESLKKTANYIADDIEKDGIYFALKNLGFI